MPDTSTSLQQSMDAIAGELMLLAEGDTDTIAVIRGGLEELGATFGVLQDLDEGPLCKSIIHRIGEGMGMLTKMESSSSAAFDEMRSTFRALIAQMCMEIDDYQKQAASPADRSDRVAVSIPGKAVTSDTIDSEMFMDFFTETNEHLETFEAMMMQLEANPFDSEAIASSFRAIHSIKGMAGFLNLVELNRLSHAMETLLDLFRSGHTVDAQSVGVLIHGLDVLRNIISVLAAIHAGKDAEINRGSFEEIYAQVVAESERVEIGETGEAESKPPSIVTAPQRTTTAVERVNNSDSVKRVDSIKVKLDRIDKLVNLVGELVITHNQVDQGVAPLVSSARLLKNLSQMNRIVADLQEMALSMRMVSIGPVFHKITRLVRDFSAQSGKKIQVVVSGEDTELDRNLIEELEDPLVHLIRNAIDHGIEVSTDRLAAGKSESGTVRLNACHQSGMVVIEIGDDGRGLNRERILKKALEKGLIRQSEELTDHQIHNLIFLPGFSTAEKVTDISGRGVGMDVVKRNIDRLRGRIDIETTKGSGTVIRLKIPLTLAIIDGMLIRVGRERMILPISAVIESLRPDRKQVTTISGKGEVVSVRGNLIPLIKLHNRLGIHPEHELPWESLVLVIQGAERTICLQVDELIGQQKVVIKSLGKALKNAKTVAGGAILGDGRVGLILDVEALVA